MPNRRQIATGNPVREEATSPSTCANQIYQPAAPWTLKEADRPYSDVRNVIQRRVYVNWCPSIRPDTRVLRTTR